MRIDGWERAHKLVIEKHRDLPGAYGISDCYMIADDNVVAVTGERMYPDAIDYTTAEGAQKRLLQHGFKNVEEAFAAKFPRHESVMQARRGDIGVVERNGEICGGIFTATGFMTREESGIYFVPLSEVKTAFKVE